MTQINQRELINKTNQILEYTVIKEKLKELAVSSEAKELIEAMEPMVDVNQCREKIEETSGAKQLLESFGTPPLPIMSNIRKVLDICDSDAALTAEQLESVATFLYAVRRMQSYLKRAELSNVGVAYYGRSFLEVEELREQINEAIVNEKVADHASNELKNIRRQMENLSVRIKMKLEQILKQKKDCFADNYVSIRNGHYVLPVRRNDKLKVPGTVIDVSSSGNTLFIEPAAVNKFEDELTLLQISEENEVQRILYMLTGMVAEYKEQILRNMETMTALDVIFAKAKLSMDQKANEPTVDYEGNIIIRQGRHPLLSAEKVVPLDFSLTKEQKGIVITGPNTGGKTVSLKTVGLLSMMARSGLHVPAEKGSVFTMHDMVLCDIGDGQSISQNLSTFSSHIKAVIGIVESITSDSLVLLDELGSGTDPKEGMGIAIAILEKLRSIGCYFVATTHYPEVKDYADRTEGIINASMAFDRETLSPLYRLVMNEAGESCALYIAKRLGMPKDMLAVAKAQAYGTEQTTINKEERQQKLSEVEKRKKQIERREKRMESEKKAKEFGIGDSVFVYPKKEIGIVFQTVNEYGEVGVQVKKKKQLIPYKRLKINVKAADLYPEDYDFSVIFDSVSTRKIRHKMEKRNGEGLTIRMDKGELQYDPDKK